MAKRYGVKRQSIDDRAKAEGWPARGANQGAGQGAGQQVLAGQSGDVGGQADTKPDINTETLLSNLPHLIQALDTSKEWQRQTDKGSGVPRGMSPKTIDQAARLALQGATWGMIADGVGLTVQGFKYWRDKDAGLDGLLRECHATHALSRLRNVNAAADRGDLRAAVWALEHGPYRHELAEIGPGGRGPAITVVLNINDPQASQDTPAQAITIDQPI